MIHTRPDDMVLTRRGLRFAGLMLPCTLGRGGVRINKREGDGATPAGVHHLVGAFFRPDRITTPIEDATPIGPRDLWSDASGRADYNTHVTAPYNHSHERLRRADPLYDLVVATDWNWPDAQAGRGSAIFVHQWRRAGFPTEGCVALRRDHLYWLARRITPTTRLIVPPMLAVDFTQ